MRTATVWVASFLVVLTLITQASANPFGKMGSASYYQQVGDKEKFDYFITPRSASLSTVYFIVHNGDGEGYGTVDWRHVQLTRVDGKPLADMFSKYFVNLIGCDNVPDLEACAKNPETVLSLVKVDFKGSRMAYHPQPDERETFVSAIGNPRAAFSVSEYIFKSPTGQLIASMSALDPRFLEFKRQGELINEAVRQRAEMARQAELERQREAELARQAEIERNRPFYIFTPGDTYYMQGAFNDIPVTVMDIDPSANRLKVRRHDDGTVKFVSPDDLLDHDQHMTNQVARGGLAAAALICVLGGCQPQ